MNTFLRREPVVNRQKAIIASRLVVHAASTRAAVQALEGIAEAWPTTRDVWVAIAGTEVDAGLLAWRPPANVLLGLPARIVAGAAGQALATQLAAAGTPLCLDDYDPAIELPAAPKFRFALADARRYPQMPWVPAVPIATGLADHRAFVDAIDSGYAGAAGWFFLRGLAPGAHKLNPSHAQIIHILNQVRQNADIGDIETALKQNIGISFKLLRYINSAGFGMAKQIQSFRHAVSILGYDKLNKWLSLLLVTASRDPAAPALMQTAIARGRFMELAAAGAIDPAQLDNLFIAGSFSLLDILLGTRIDAVLAEMALPAAISDALLHRAGPYAPFLELALACEQEDIAALAARAADLGLAAAAVNRAQVAALAFADSLQLD
ncbi:MAG: HDOD domain-containing protein [Rhodocyclaceae bacterium]|nr:HDOD domain-containing protein [Rhodocyclaceae bacterium]